MPNGRGFELDSKGIRDLLRSDAVVADLRRRAERVKARAGPGMQSGVGLERDRARAAVWTATFEGRLAEARNRSLTRAIDAARG